MYVLCTSFLDVSKKLWQARQWWQCLFIGGIYSPGHKTVLENMWFLMVVALPQATPSLSDSLAASIQDCLFGFPPCLMAIRYPLPATHPVPEARRGFRYKYKYKFCDL